MRGYGKDNETPRQRLLRIEGPPISAAAKALEAVALHLREGHLPHCLHETIGVAGPDAEEKSTEAAQTVHRLVRPGYEGAPVTTQMYSVEGMRDVLRVCGCWPTFHATNCGTTGRLRAVRRT
jgi:hypothetical protein